MFLFHYSFFQSVKERYIVSGGSADCLCLYIFYVLTDRKKEIACLLRVFAKGRRNNGVYICLWGYSCHSGSSCQFAGKPIAFVIVWDLP